MDINAVVLHYVVTSSGDEILTKTALISDDVVEERVKQRKFRIPMSDEPGNYEEDELHELLMRYLSQDMVSARRIRDVFLPVCLASEKVQREQLKEEFVRRDAASEPNASLCLQFMITPVTAYNGTVAGSFAIQYHNRRRNPHAFRAQRRAKVDPQNGARLC